ncbi:MAG TPA: EAL domain-containing protein, partial [Candidatus Tenderia electrophaga]|nr:EAL domain-containing protein [Candidatus Tenderia electrophaga]
ALLRWIHPERGFIPPDAFIPLAEQTGLIHPLTQWVLKTGVEQARQWHDKGVTLNVAINLSAQSLRDPGLVDSITTILDEAGLEPKYLTLELTETAVMSDPKQALEILSGLDEKGVMLSIDDFGTGYSSLAYLKRLPVDEIKIDRSFVMEMDGESNDKVIVQSTIDLAHNMGLKVVAEGIETEQSWQTLKALGCDMGQGYLMCRPIEAASLDQWFEESDWKTPAEDL